MKRTLMLFAAGFVALAISACSLAPVSQTPAQTPAQLIAAAQAKIKEGCDIVQPTFDVLTPIAPTFSGAQQTVYGTFVKVTNTACAANAAIDTDSIDDLVKTIVPQASALIATSSLSDTDKLKYEGFLVAFQIALSAAEVQFRAAAAAPTSTASTGATLQ